MQNSNHIKYKVLNSTDLHSKILYKFIRYQETNRVWMKENDEYHLKNDHFIEEWGNDKKSLVTCSLQNCIKSGGIVVGAYINTDLIGFASVEGERFGNENEYLELSYIHVSSDFRNRGIGKGLFELSREEAKQKGAKKLYIASHPSVETQQFYKSLGCIEAEEINQQIFEKEPLDIQLEMIL